MAVTGTQTVRDIVTHAMRKSGMMDWNESPTATEAEFARMELNFMLKGWQNLKYNLWTYTAGSLTLTTAASYTLDPVRPLRILTARLRQNGRDLPMTRLTREEYDNLPNKAATGLPTQFYYDRQREAARFYVWPVLSAASGETIEYTYERELEDVGDLTDVIDMPGEWWAATIANLAVRLAEATGLEPRQVLLLEATGTLEAALGADREESVFFGAEPE